jgi:hypothetical protein
MRSALLIAPIVALIGSASYAGELAERLNGPVSFALQSAKQPIALELCVADAIGNMGSPGAFQDGPNRVVITADAVGKYYAAVELNGSPRGTQVVAHVYGRVFEAKVRKAISACL